MHYKSLYRKYRPVDFESVFGQDHIIKSLKTSIKNDSINHAYLFSGERGTGKTTVAKIFSKTINCLNLNDGKPCNKCETCLKDFDEIQDIIEIDAASNNGVDEIREIKNKVNLVPNSCKYKVYIIDEVHMLSTGAFNALLKTLEEPPSHVIFILATTEIHKMPLTIISRCQRYDFKKITVKKIIERLEFICKKEKIDSEDGVLEEIAKISEGSLRDAIGFLEQLSTYCDDKIKIQDIYDMTGTIKQDDMFKIIECIINNKSDELLNIIEELSDLGKDFEKISDQMFLILREILLFKKAPKYFENKKTNDYKNIKEISDQMNEEVLLKIIKSLNECIYEMKQSTYPNLIFEIFLIKNISSNIKEEKKIKDKQEEKQQKIEVSKDEKKQEMLKVVEKIELKTDLEEAKPIDSYKKILINNTLALAKKECIKEICENIKGCEKFLINKKYKEVATILLDAKVVAASEQHVLLTYEYDSILETHDNEIKKVESLIKELTNKKYKVVAITEKEWKKIRPYYVELKKKNKGIELLEEIEVIIMKKEEKHILIENAIDMFGKELVEMEG